MANVFVGLDGEMTGGSRVVGGLPRLCQIGLSLGANDSFGSDIGWQVGDYTYEQEALNVNGFTHDRIISGPPAAEVDEAMYKWLTEHGIGPRDGVPVGFAVGSFDMPFVRETLPKSADLFTRRCVDLTAICFAIEEARRTFEQTPNNALMRSRWKQPSRAAKAYAEKVMGKAQWHDAEFDAIAALLCFQYLSSEIGRALFE